MDAASIVEIDIGPRHLAIAGSSAGFQLHGRREADREATTEIAPGLRFTVSMQEAWARRFR
jgi:hypothetical protein